MNAHRISEVYQTSLEINRDTFAEGEYEIACQILFVALRCGYRLRDIHCLIEVERLAEKESRYIDDHHPESPYSRKAAAGRGVFYTVAQQAKAIIQEFESSVHGAPLAPSRFELIFSR